MDRQIDKKYLMRNFPLSYFSNLDVLFKIVDKQRKFNSKSCKNIKRVQVFGPKRVD